MKQTRLNRRQFFKLSAFGAGMLAASSLVSVVGSPPEHVVAQTRQPQLAIPQPTFNPIASMTAFGPPTDISAGWDGTMWATDASGAPHLYDPTQNAWLVHGEGVDAAARFGAVDYFFRGGDVLQINVTTNATTLTTIAQAFPNVPDSFKLGVLGAAVLDNALVLFKGGRYVRADGSSAPRKLTDLPDWPKTPPWQDGLITGVYYDSSGVYLLNGPECAGYFDLYGPFVSRTGPDHISKLYNWGTALPAAWQTAGIDAGVPSLTGFTLFRGTAVVQFSLAATNPVTPSYIPAVYPTWPATWNPALNHAPSGRMGSLWAATRAGGAVQHNGAAWVARDGAGQGITSVSSGSDGSTFMCSVGSPTLWQWTGTSWNAVATHSTNLSQVAVGSAGHVWMRDANNAPHRFASGAFTTVNLGAGVPNPTHMAANNDGTLWHCNSGNPNAYRFVSEATAASSALPLKPGITTSVQKVASTGFGAAHCLAAHSDGTVQVYRYDSPYVFKTSQPYVLWGKAPMAQGLGRLYFVQQVSFPNSGTLNVRFVAIDVHTGAEVASYTPAVNTLEYTGMVFDPINDLVYVGTAPVGQDGDFVTPGQLIALDARTLAVKWRYQTAAGIDATPILHGAQLCIADRSGAITLFNTSAALANAPSPKPAWTNQIVDWNNTARRLAQRTTVTLANGLVYVAGWAIFDAQPNGEPASTSVVVASCNAMDGSNVQRGGIRPASPAVDQASWASYADTPVVGKISISGAAVPSLLINGANAVFAARLDQPLSDLPPAGSATFALPTGRISTGFAWDDGTRLGAGLSSSGPSINAVRLWFGDTAGNLWSLNSALQPVDNTPHTLGAQSSVFTTPVLYKDPQGGITVLSGLSPASGGSSPQPPSLYGYDPVTGQHAAVPTGVTYIWNLAQGTANGVVYAAGGGNSTPDGQVSQVFGIRVDELPQALRDFIIESQLMQDPDPNAPGGDPSSFDSSSGGSEQAPSDPTNPIPASRARYQTHLTLVDDGKHPVVNEPVKIWSDQPMTIQVDGTSYDIGPGDAQYAAIKTGSDGALVITSGHAKPDGSDTPDLYVPALRVWAGFMDPYERVVVNPDHEFHQRTSTAHSNAGDDDPAKVNLVTCKSYAGRGGAKPAALFTSDEVNAGQPKNCADAISQMKSGVGFGGGSASNATATLFNRLMLHAGGRRQARRTIRSAAFVASAATAPPPKYVAYADLLGTGYFPTNIPAVRPTTVSQTTGMVFTKPQGQPTTKAAFSAVHHTDAAAAIDALPPPTPNPPWAKPSSLVTDSPTQPSPKGRGLQTANNIFTDFWNWLKGVAAEITHIIVSVAEEVTVGIRMIVNGIEQVFKAVVRVIDDIASAIGSFFKMLEKFIEDVVAALSVLFNFGEIMWTHRWMAQQFNQRVGTLAADIKAHVIPAVDGFFKQGEGAITDFFKKLRGDLGPNDGINNLKGSGTTPHTLFSVGPGGNSGASQATQCNWGTQKLKTGMPSATTAAATAPTGDPLSDFFTGFVARLTGDGDLSIVLRQIKSDFGQLFTANSAQQFFSTLLLTLLDLLEALLVGALAIAGAFVDGVLALIDDVIQAVLAALNAEIQIPVLTWLYESLFNEPLTFLNMVTLVAAIPVTVIYRVAEGKYPSQALPAIGAIQAAGAEAVPPALQRLIGLFNACNNFLLGLLGGFGDLKGADAPPTLDKAVVAVGLIVTVLSIPSIGADSPSTDEWVVFGLTATWALAGVFSLEQFNLADQAALPWCTMAMGVLILVAVIIQFVDSNSHDVGANAGLANGIATAIVALANPIKLAGPPFPGPAIVCVIDVAGGIVVAVTDLIQAFAAKTATPFPYRLHFPFVPFNPLPMSAQPHP